VPIPRWISGPFELLVQAELHYRGTTEQDKRLACILYDNAVEVSIVTYVHLDVRQRNGKRIAKDKVEEVGKGFHSAITFCFEELGDLVNELNVEIGDFIHFHRMRNEQYHAATLTSPNQEDLSDLRNGVTRLFELLFGISNVEQEIEGRINELLRPLYGIRNDVYDKLIDEACDLITIADMTFSPSEVLYAVDPSAYQEVGRELSAESLLEFGFDQV